MDQTSTLARLHGMDDAVWQSHANPLSVWTRVPVLPLLALAIWARVWLGWFCLFPIAALMFWTWINPRAFGPPTSTDNWASKGVMGERVWLNDARLPIPGHHKMAARVLNGFTALGLIPLIYGLWTLSIWPTLLGLVMVVGGKLWFIDRMVWLFDDMRPHHPMYQAWMR